MTRVNEAAWLVSPGAYPLEIGPAPYTTPGPRQVVIRTGAVAVNPMDWAKQAVGDMKWEWLSHPHILGEDVAGEVVEVGTEVTRFRVGDRILAHAVGFYLYGNRAAEGGFQRYTIVRDHMAAPIPSNLSFTAACVVPMCCSAAACALYQKPFLGLDAPTVPARPLNGQVVIITGASTAVGSNAIQLACASGYEVATTCSARGADRARSLGATLVFDYASATCEADMAVALTGRRVAGAFAIGPGSVELCVGVLGRLRGAGADDDDDSCGRLVVKASFPWPGPEVGGDGYPAHMKWVDEWNRSIDDMAAKAGVTTKFVEGAELGLNEVSKLIYEDFLPGALAEGQYVATPEPQVVGNGLQCVQEALNLQRKGVNARKIVVSLEL